MTIKPRDRRAGSTQPRGQSADDRPRAETDPNTSRVYLDLIFIARNIERIGDHATNIAEDAVYVRAAQDVRHSFPAAGA